VAQPAFFKRVVEGLGRKAKPGTKLHLLRIIRVVCDNHPERANLVQRFGLSTVVEQLGRQDDAVLVREVRPTGIFVWVLKRLTFFPFC
jgi:hypothetical protein